MSSADQITKQSRSNLAFAFLALRQKKGAILPHSMRFAGGLTMWRMIPELL